MQSEKCRMKKLVKLKLFFILKHSTKKMFPRLLKVSIIFLDTEKVIYAKMSKLK